MNPFTKADSERFSVLVRKRALNTATEKETAEFNRLQRKRRCDFNKKNPDWVRANRNASRRYKRMRDKIRGLIENLQKPKT